MIYIKISPLQFHQNLKFHFFIKKIIFLKNLKYFILMIFHIYYQYLMFI